MSGWQTMETARKDGSEIVAACGGADGVWQYLNGRRFVISHGGVTPSGYDLGWNVFPGLGGAPDRWFTKWAPLLPDAPQGALPK